MIKLKKKPCKYHQGKECYIFSKGMCREGWLKTYGKKIKPRKMRVQDNTTLNENIAYQKAFYASNSTMLLSGTKVHYASLKPANKCHILPKGLYPYFKYYWENIFFGTLLEHDIWDGSRIGMQSRGREIVKHYQSGKSKKENWKILLKKEKELKEEYKIWLKSHKGIYKI